MSDITTPPHKKGGDPTHKRRVPNFVRPDDPCTTEFKDYYDYFKYIVNYSEARWEICNNGRSTWVDASPAPKCRDTTNILSKMDETKLGETPVFYFYLTKEMRDETLEHTQYKYLQIRDLSHKYRHTGRWHSIVKQALNMVENTEISNEIQWADVLLKASDAVEELTQDEIRERGFDNYFESKTKEMSPSELENVFNHIYKLGMVYWGSLKERAKQYNQNSALMFSGNVRTFGAWWKVTIPKLVLNRDTKLHFVQRIERQIHDFLNDNKCIMVKTKNNTRDLTEEYVFGKNFPDVVNLVNDFFTEELKTQNPRLAKNPELEVKYTDLTNNITERKLVGRGVTTLFPSTGSNPSGTGSNPSVSFISHNNAVVYEMEDDVNTKAGSATDNSTPIEKQRGGKLLDFTKLKF